MTLRWMVLVVAALLLASVAWRYRSQISAWLAPEPLPRAIVFDNDASAPPPLPASAAAGPLVRPPGVMRKCVRGSQTSYTDRPCPPGFRERDLAADRVTVLPAAPVAAASQPGQRKTLKQALDVADEDRLRERMIERAVEGATR
ncbi:MAG: hypothetical protein JNM33_07250 [Rubrivivax sp.]|nr:hypothetical protein [Rubrivivax sp.]